MGQFDVDTDRSEFEKRATLFTRWVLLNIVSLLLIFGIVLFALFSNLPQHPDPSPSFDAPPFVKLPITTIAIVAAFTFFLGVVQGGIQWWLLRRFYLYGLRWIILTGVGWTIGILLGLIISDWLEVAFSLDRALFFDEAVFGLLHGGSVGFFQYMFFYSNGRSSIWWIVANILGSAILIFAFFGFVIIGLFSSVFTGLVLVSVDLKELDTSY